ncbi:unnamed protein product [Boreogadus saida]
MREKEFDRHTVVWPPVERAVKTLGGHAGSSLSQSRSGEHPVHRGHRERVEFQILPQAPTTPREARLILDSCRRPL